MIGSLEDISLDRNPNRRYRVGTVASIEDLPPALRSCSPHYVLLLAMDATRLQDDCIRAVARTLIDGGLASLSVWGPDCSRVHDQLDLERDPDEADDRTVMTTWHDDEPLSQAVWYFDYCAFVDTQFEHDCTDWVAISVGNEDWEREIRRSLMETTDDEA